MEAIAANKFFALFVRTLLRAVAAVGLAGKVLVLGTSSFFRSKVLRELAKEKLLGSSRAPRSTEGSLAALCSAFLDSSIEKFAGSSIDLITSELMVLLGFLVSLDSRLGVDGSAGSGMICELRPSIALRPTGPSDARFFGVFLVDEQFSGKFDEFVMAASKFLVLFVRMPMEFAGLVRSFSKSSRLAGATGFVRSVAASTAAIKFLPLLERATERLGAAFSIAAIKFLALLARAESMCDMLPPTAAIKFLPLRDRVAAMSDRASCPDVLPTSAFCPPIAAITFLALLARLDVTAGLCVGVLPPTAAIKFLALFARFEVTVGLCGGAMPPIAANKFLALLARFVVMAGLCVVALAPIAANKFLALFERLGPALSFQP